MKNIIVAVDLARSPGRNTLGGFFSVANEEADWHLRILTGPDRLSRTLSAWSVSRPDAVVTEYPDTPHTLTALAALGVPTVFTSYLTAPDACTPTMAFVRLDNLRIGATAAAHFDSLGVFATYVFATERADFRWSQDRELTFFANRTNATRKSFSLISDYPSERENLAYAKTLERMPKPIAVYAASDTAALRMLDICRLAGLSVPEQVALLGTDNDELMVANARPSVSSIALNHRELGIRAAKILSLMLDGRSVRDQTVKESVLGISRRESTRIVPPAKALVERALDFIERHANENISSADVRRHLGVSRQLLDLRFREFRNRSVGQEIVFARVGRIKRLLSSRPRSITEIAGLCGFSDASALSRYFKRATGITPSKWK